MDKNSKIVAELGELSQDSVKSIKDKLTNLKDKFIKAEQHLDQIEEIEGKQTISKDMKSSHEQVHFSVIGRGQLFNAEELYRYLYLLLASEIQKVENTSIKFDTLTVDWIIDESKNINDEMKCLEKRYNKFFEDIKELKNKNDLESFWYGSYDKKAFNARSGEINCILNECILKNQIHDLKNHEELMKILTDTCTERVLIELESSNISSEKTFIDKNSE